MKRIGSRAWEKIPQQSSGQDEHGAERVTQKVQKDCVEIVVGVALIGVTPASMRVISMIIVAAVSVRVSSVRFVLMMPMTVFLGLVVVLMAVLIALVVVLMAVLVALVVVLMAVLVRRMRVTVILAMMRRVVVTVVVASRFFVVCHEQRLHFGPFASRATTASRHNLDHLAMILRLL